MRKALKNERLEALIFTIRGHRVVLDADLARLYSRRLCVSNDDRGI